MATSHVHPLPPSDFFHSFPQSWYTLLPICNDGRVKIFVYHIAIIAAGVSGPSSSIYARARASPGQAGPGQRDWATASEEAKAKTKHRKHNKRVPTAFESKLKSQLSRRRRRRRSEDQSVPRRRWVRIGLLVWRMCKWLDGQAKATGSRVQLGLLIAAPKLWACDT